MRSTKVFPIGAALLALAAAGACTGPDNSIQIAQTTYITDCAAPKKSDAQVGQGAIDFGYFDLTGQFPDDAPRYLLGITIKSNLNSNGVTASQGTETNPSTRNDFLLSSLHVRYLADPGVPGIAEKLMPLTGTIPAGGDLTLIAQMLTDEAVMKLAATAKSSTGGLMVRVGLRVRGSFAYGSEYESEELVFPLMTFYSYDQKPGDFYCPSSCTAAACPTSLQTWGANPMRSYGPQSGSPMCANYGQDYTSYTCVPYKPSTSGTGG